VACRTSFLYEDGMADRGSSAEQRAAIARQRRAAVANAGSFYEHAPLPSDKDIQNAMLAGRREDDEGIPSER
jgi:hypothetical protein